MTSEQKNLKDKVLGTIQSGEVTMRPRLYFSLQVAGLALLSFAVLVISVFIFNFILFSLRINHQDMLLGVGPRGWIPFLQFFPWPWLAIDIGLILILESLLRNFRLGYRVPALYLLGVLLFFTVAVAAVIDRGTPINDRLFERRHELPSPVGEFYLRARQYDGDDSLRRFGIPPPDFVDERPATNGPMR